VAAGCGGGQEGTTTPVGGNDADRVFIEEMVPHHVGGVELGELAQQRGEHPETKKLGRQVETAQAREIEQMEAAYTRLFDEELPVEQEHDPAVAELEVADPFDRAFYDELIPHHQDAIVMARTELAEGKDPEMRELAQSIVETQSQEIEDMNEWRERYYGAPSPAGGVPSEEETGEHGQSEDEHG
jgi:uncharacterized protein (DUF305 family)